MIKEKIILNLPIDTGKEFFYYPLTYKNYLLIGENNYFILMNFLKTFIIKLPEKNRLKNTLILCSDIKVNENHSLLFVLLKMLKITLRVDNIEIDRNTIIWCNELLINNNVFTTLLDIMLEEYKIILNKEEEEKYNPKDKKAQEIIDKMNEAKEKVNKIKSNEEKDVIPGEKILIKTCYDLGMSAEEFYNNSAAYCLNMIDFSSKNTVLQTALAGADMEKIKMKDLF